MPTPFPRPDRLLSGPSAWRGEQLSRSDQWIHEWTHAQIADLEHALHSVRAGGRPLSSIGREDCPLGSLADTLDDLRAELLRGRGFVLMRGLDAARYTRKEIATLFWIIGAHLGRALPQNAEGHLLGHVKDLGRDAHDPTSRIYQTRERQGYHTDSADIVGLLCLQPAMEGGCSSLASASTIHNTLFESAPGLLAELFEPLCTDHRGEHGEGAKPYFTAPVLSWHERSLSVLYQRKYIESAQRFPDVPRLTERQIAALDAFDRAADDPAIHLRMELQGGDIQFIHNHQMLHDRTAFRDWPEPGRSRHLLRLWLCPRDGRPLPSWFAERLHSTEPGQRGGVVLDGVEPGVSLSP
ncbi:MAG: TauD/TfdA family dioxygenase [Planctomycetota bacterium]